MQYLQKNTVARRAMKYSNRTTFAENVTMMITFHSTRFLWHHQPGSDAAVVVVKLQVLIAREVKRCECDTVASYSQKKPRPLPFALSSLTDGPLLQRTSHEGDSLRTDYATALMLSHRCIGETAHNVCVRERARVRVEPAYI